MRKLLLASWFLTFTLPLFAADDWHTFTDLKGRTVVGKMIKRDGDSVVIELRQGGRQATLTLDQLSPQDVAYITIIKDDTTTPAATTPTPDANEEIPGDEPQRNRLYPRTRDEIRSTIREILKRPREKDISKELQEATNQLNVYRFLCGVPYQVKPNNDASKAAEDAAIACKNHGGLSHTIGHSTDLCNLSSIGDFVASVSQYIEDSGDNNRDARGHREWCLNPPMAKVGFGSAGDRYSAMWCMDHSGKSIKSIWSYPGSGWFPLDYMHGNAWSIYGIKRPPSPDQVKIEIYRLPKRPEQPYNSTEKIPGKEIKVNHISFGMSAINFEPEDPAKRGIYWVRIRGDGLREGYLVELY